MSTSQLAPSSAKPGVKATSPKDKAQSRKKRAPRRRARARGDFESDEEIEREAASSESEDDDDDRSSSSDSATDDSDTEPGSEDVPSNIQTPAVSKDVAVEGVAHINGAVAPFFETSLAWSEMVTDEHENGAAGLPVIEFTEFTEAAKIPPAPAKKSRKQKNKKAAPPTPPAATAKEPEPAEEEAQAVAPPEATAESGSQLPPRRHGQTARQAYQERLEKDPSYVPKVGGFWGHDDRLMEKDLRSLSGWWRGQWQGRGRGRGFGGRGGGRGGHASHNSAEVSREDLPPVERAWTHDGFEEMKRREEEYRGTRGRGGVHGGRGGGAGRGRGAFKPQSAPRTGPSTPTTKRSGESLKPENVQSQLTPAALFYEPKAKSRVRVKVPGKQVRVVKLGEGSGPVKPPSDTAQPTKPATLPQLQYVIRLPKPKEEQAVEPEAPAPAETVPPQPLATEAIAASISEVPPAPVVSIPHVASDGTCSSQPSPAVVSQLEQLSIEPTFHDPGRQALTEEAVLRNPSQGGDATEASASEQRPTLPPLQTVFTPPPPAVSQASPVYGSPYAFPHAPLPPGIAINHHGMPYEVATGRPVYLQAPPPPPPMYNPQPIMAPHHYGHVRHPSSISMTSMSPDFLAQPPSHTPPMNPMNNFVDPGTGAPIFSFPRPNARVEIRAPDASESLRSPPSGKATAANRGPSKLRTTAVAFEPSRPQHAQVTNGEGYYPSINTPSDGSGIPPSYEAVNGVQPEDPSAQQMAPPMMPYNPYAQQQYYYPETYGYPPYMEMSHHPGQYEGYVDQGQQQAVYY